MNNNHKNGLLRHFQRKFFDYTSLEEQSVIDAHIKEAAKDNVSYYILVVVSVVIITIGLIVDSPAVVIGGMIIAPVIWPLLALSVGIIHGRPTMLKESIFTLIKTIIIILLFSFLIGLVSPLDDLSGEIISRTGPTLFNLIIALAAGFGAAFATIYAKRSATIFGVAIAVALVPPLCTFGVLLSFARIDLMGGALLLFLANFIAILISSMIVFALAHFSGPKTKIGEENKTRAIYSTILAFIIICIPLGYLTWNVVSLNKVENAASSVFQQNFKDYEILDLKVTKGKYSYTIKGQILATEEINDVDLNIASQLIAKQVGRPVNIELNQIAVKETSAFSENAN